MKDGKRIGWQMREAFGRLVRLSIGKKILLGFISYGVLTLVLALFVLSSLEQINRINKGIVERDIPLIELGDKLVETVLGQQLQASRSILLKTPETSLLFWKSGDEFKNLVSRMGNLPGGPLPLRELSVLQKEYTSLFSPQSGTAALSSPAGGYEEMERKHEQILQLARKISAVAREEQIEKRRRISEIGSKAFRVTAWLSVLGILLGVLTLVTARNIAGSITQLKLSTREISEGKFDDLPRVRSSDELGDLSQSFQEMALRLKQLEATYLDANPLTRLPGGVAIEQKLKTLLAEEAPLAFCLADLRNFKAFNDRYGYARGNEVILGTAEIIRSAVKEHGREGDFIGHVGGDDLVFIVSPADYDRICGNIVDNFDRQIATFYDPEDRERGCIRGKTRRGEEVVFPIMTIAIAVVTNQNRKLGNHIQIGEIAAEMKNYAKNFSRSIYVADQRKDSAPEAEPQLNTADEQV